MAICRERHRGGRCERHRTAKQKPESVYGKPDSHTMIKDRHFWHVPLGGVAVTGFSANFQQSACLHARISKTPRNVG
jgi:hypothetical protein